MAMPTNQSQPATSSASAASTAPTARSDEDGSTSSARREGSQEPSSPRLSLTSLPTEILAAIISQVPYNDYYRTIDQVLVNRRFYGIAYPVWIGKILLSEERRDVMLAGLARRNVPHVTHFTGTLTPSLPHLQCIVFDHLPNLTHLDIAFTEDEDHPLPDCFFHALRRLRHLVYLKVQDDERDEPPNGFSFAEDVPSLCELDIDAYGSLANCAPGLSKIERLRLHSFDSVGSAIPWDTLHHLDIERRRYDPSTDNSDLRDFLSSLRVACNNSAIPLRSLALCFLRSGGYDPDGLIKILEVLYAPHLTELTAYGIKAFTGMKFPTSSPRLQSVQRLILRGDSEVISMDDFRGLQAILALFPAVKVLRLEDFKYFYGNSRFHAAIRQSVHAKTPILDAIAHNDLPNAFPAITALLFFLMHTSVLDLQLTTSDEDGITWSRASRSEVFEAKGWRVI